MCSISMIFAVISITAIPVWGENRSIILYLDGARIEAESTVIKEQGEILLPASTKEGSLRIKPLDGCMVMHVEVEPAKSDPLKAKELSKLAERRGVLMDRLKALELRESIFISAAKSQSGKAPRKTKLNPEPLNAVRQGTEYAIAQLEGVYRARRIADSELKSLDDRIESINKYQNERVAKVSLSRRVCRIEVSYLRSDLKWLPAYDFRLDKAGEAKVLMHAIIPAVGRWAQVAVVTSNLAEAADESVWPVDEKNSNSVASFVFPVEQEIMHSIPISSVSFSFKNQSTRRLPAGDASCFYRGEYLGRTFFKGASPGETIEIIFGH